MADPTIQTFCCHWPNVTDSSVSIMQEFNSHTYNTVGSVSSFIGMLGAIYQILPREIVETKHRWNSFTALRGRQIIIWLACADLLASLGVFTRSILWLNLPSIVEEFEAESDDTSAVLICSITSAWIQYFYTATWMWTLCYAIDMQFAFKHKEGHPKIYHIVSWTLPAITTSVGLSVLYLPHANCHSLNSLSSAILHILPNYFATYIPIATVMIVNPIIYMKLTPEVQLQVSFNLNQYTSKEREIVDAIRVKFCLINFSFYFCWLPNIVNGILLWTLWFNLPEKIILVLWYIMAITNPLQALCNCFVYRRWVGSSEKLYLPCRQQNSESEQPDADDSPIPWTRRSPRTERTPLLQGAEYQAGFPQSIINEID